MTLLADKFVAHMVATQDQFSADGARQYVGAAPKFRIMPEVLAVAQQITDTRKNFERTKDLPRPQSGNMVWLECMHAQGLRAGAIMSDEGGVVVLYHPPTNIWSLRNFTWNSGELKVDTQKGEDLRSIEFLVMQQTLSIFQVTLSLMENPRLVESRPVTIDAPLQRARERRGKLPLSDYSEVVVHITKKELEAREAAADHERRTGRKLHYVRMFHRVRHGKVERVREHWRGDAGRGMKPKPTNYRVTL